MTPEEARALGAKHAADTITTEAQRFAAAVAAAADARGASIPGEVFNVSRPGMPEGHGDVVVVVGGFDHGTYHVKVTTPKGTKDDPEPEPVAERIRVSEVVAWRSAVARTYGAVDDGRRQTVETWTVTVQGNAYANPPFAVSTIEGLSTPDSLRFTKVFEGASVHMADSADRAVHARFQTALKNLNAQARDITEAFGTLGWHEVPGEGTWYASTNLSMAPDGTLSDRRVVPTEPGDVGAPLRQYAFANRVPTGADLERAACAVRDYPDILDTGRTTKRHVPAALLGVLVGSLLGVGMTTVSLVAKKGRGKTAVGCTWAAFYAPQTVESVETWLFTDESSTLAGMSRMLGVARNCPVFFDDHKRYPDDKAGTDRIAKQANQGSTWAYGGGKGIQGSPGGGNARVSAEKKFGAIETGEERVADSSRLSRYVALAELTAEDLRPASQRPTGRIAPVDWLATYRGAPGRDGLAASFFTALISWLTVQVNTEGSWIADGQGHGTRRMEEVAAQRYNRRAEALVAAGVGGDDGRAARNVARCWLGLDVLRQFMRESGIEAYLPWTEAEVETIMVGCAREVAGIHEDGSAERALAGFLARAIASKRAYVEAPDPTRASTLDATVALAAGHVPGAATGAGAGATPIGRMSNDHKVVWLNRPAVEALLRDRGPAMGDLQVGEALRECLAPGYRDRFDPANRRGFRATRSECESRPVGYPVLAAPLLGMDEADLVRAAERVAKRDPDAF